MAKPDHLHFFIDPSRCIGCQACVQACSECDTHRGDSMIHLEFVDRASSIQTVPVVCMHCDQPTCAEVCPADAIKRTADGVVQSARKPRCIACGNCVVACPFGVPEVYEDRKIMMKCDMCYDRTSAGKKSVNQLTVAAQDPISKIPQYKVCGCRLRKAAGPPDYEAWLEPQQ